jgi:hypothetical protein
MVIVPWCSPLSAWLLHKQLVIKELDLLPPTICSKGLHTVVAHQTTAWKLSIWRSFCDPQYKGVSILCAQLKDGARYQPHHMFGNLCSWWLKDEAAHWLMSQPKELVIMEAPWLATNQNLNWEEKWLQHSNNQRLTETSTWSTLQSSNLSKKDLQKFVLEAPKPIENPPF